MAGTGGNPRTEVTSVTVSLENVGSAGLAAETVAVFEMGPNTAGAVTVIVNATFAELLNEAAVHVTVPPKAWPE